MSHASGPEPSAAVSYCEICPEIDGTSSFPYASKYNSVNRIVQSNRFSFVVAAVSPLSIGHVLLLPRRHVTSVAQLTAEERFDIAAMITAVRPILKAVDPDYELLVWEHGIGSGRCGGCGITHAHIHLLPMEKAHRRVILRTLRTELSATRIPGLSWDSRDFCDPSRSYLMVGSPDDSYLVSYSDFIPSQYMRRQVAEVIGKDHWDWKRVFGVSEFESTLRLFNEAGR